VLQNLLSNAIKYTDAGRVILIAEHEEDGIAFEVRDTGIGIPEEALRRLFKPYEQSDNSYARRQLGTGLGLSIVKAIVDALGGTVSVSSQTGEGSAFRVRLPLAPLAADESAEEEGELELLEPAEALSPDSMHEHLDREGVSLASEETAAEVRRGHVLLVDDESVNRLVYSAFLKGQDYDLHLAQDAREALSIVEKGIVPDLVITDIQLPDIDGIQLAAQLKRTLVPPPPIVALTAFAGEQDLTRLRAEGFAAVLTKPISRDALREVVSRRLGA
jgi:CheY-like chemotaxis protein